jgi:Phosphate-selective porin O and P
MKRDEVKICVCPTGPIQCPVLLPQSAPRRHRARDRFRSMALFGNSLVAFLFSVSVADAAAPSIADLQHRIEILEKQVQDALKAEQELQGLKAELKTVEAQAAQAQAQAHAAQSQAQAQVQVAERQARAAQAEAKAAQVSAASAAGANDDQLIKFHLSGSVVADYVASDAKGSHSSFVGGAFLPIFLASYSDWLLFEGHMEIASTSEGETETSLEYAQLDFLVNDYLTVTAGKFLSPIGQFQQALHPPWINKLPDRPPGFVEDGGDEPLTDVGIMARGGFPVGNLTGTYAVYVGNGPRMGDAGPVLEGFGGDDNGNKAVGGRLSIFPMPSLELGVSAMHAGITGMEAMSGSVTQADYNLVGADFAFTRQNWDIRGEFLHSHLGAIMSALDPSDAAPAAIPATRWDNWYVQAAYRLAGLSDDPIVAKFEPVVRYSQFHVSGLDDFAEGAENRWSFGLDYWFAPSVVAKVAYENQNYLSGTTVNLFHAQAAFGF